MKIIKINTSKLKHLSDELIAENVPEEYAEVMQIALNDKYKVGYFIVTTDSYKMYKTGVN